MNIKDLDLNLLRLFDAVWRTRSVSLAAQQLGLSQPAASQGLARLRAVLGDALFERSGSGVRPTPRADRLAQAVVAVLAEAIEAGGTTLNDFADGEGMPGEFQIGSGGSDIERFFPPGLRDAYGLMV